MVVTCDSTLHRLLFGAGKGVRHMVPIVVVAVIVVVPIVEALDVVANFNFGLQNVNDFYCYFHSSSTNFALK